jgi:hypothetical protein
MLQGILVAEASATRRNRDRPNTVGQHHYIAHHTLARWCTVRLSTHAWIAVFSIYRSASGMSYVIFLTKLDKISATKYDGCFRHITQHCWARIYRWYDRRRTTVPWLGCTCLYVFKRMPGLTGQVAVRQCQTMTLRPGAADCIWSDASILVNALACFFWLMIDWPDIDLVSNAPEWLINFHSDPLSRLPRIRYAVTMHNDVIFKEKLETWCGLRVVT